MNHKNRSGELKSAPEPPEMNPQAEATPTVGADLPPPPPPPPATAMAARLGADYLLEIQPFFFGRKKARRSREDRTSKLLQELKASDTDPMVFDLMLSNEIDRRLKTRFGVVFVALTFLFTASSYAIVVLNGIFQWNISSAAITGLIIETPIQFIGILFIIARNLFPESSRTKPVGVTPATKRRTSARGQPDRA